MTKKGWRYSISPWCESNKWRHIFLVWEFVPYYFLCLCYSSNSKGWCVAVFEFQLTRCFWYFFSAGNAWRRWGAVSVLSFEFDREFKRLNLSLFLIVTIRSFLPWELIIALGRWVDVNTNKAVFLSTYFTTMFYSTRGTICCFGPYIRTVRPGNLLYCYFVTLLLCYFVTLLLCFTPVTSR